MDSYLCGSVFVVVVFLLPVLAVVMIRGMEAGEAGGVRDGVDGVTVFESSYPPPWNEYQSFLGADEDG